MYARTNRVGQGFASGEIQSGRTRNGTRLARRLLVPASHVPFKRRDRDSTKTEPLPSAANDLVIVTPKRPMRLRWSSLIRRFTRGIGGTVCTRPGSSFHRSAQIFRRTSNRHCERLRTTTRASLGILGLRRFFTMGSDAGDAGLALSMIRMAPTAIGLEASKSLPHFGNVAPIGGRG